MPAARAASSDVCRLGRIGARPGTCSAYSSLTRSLVPITKQVSRSDARAMLSTSRIGDRGLDHRPEHGVVGRAVPLEGGDQLAHLGGAVDLGYDDRVGAGLRGGPEVVVVPLGADAVDPDGERTAAVLAARHGRCAASRAAGLASGATASSRSKITASIGSVLAFSSALALELGM